MSKSNRILAVLLAFVLCASMFLVGSVSANDADITVTAKPSADQVEKGDKLTVDFVLSNDYDISFAAGDFVVNYDPAVFSVEEDEGFVTSYTAGSIVEETSNLAVSNPNPGELRVLYCDETDTQDAHVKANGTLVSVEFTVIDVAQGGVSEITFPSLSDFVLPKEDSSEFLYYTAAGVSGAVNLVAPTTTTQATTQQPTQTSTTEAPITEQPTQDPTQATTQAPVTQAPTQAPATLPPVTLPAQVATTKAPTTTKKATVKKPYKVRGLKLKAGKRKVTVTFKKAKNAKKYIVKYSTRKNMKKAKTVTTKKLKVIIKKLQSKKRIYVQVQGVNGKVKGKISVKRSVRVK
jgi:hypothetical protein